MNVIAERTAADLALSDLIIDRVRSQFGFDFLGAENTPPGLVNDAYLSSVGRYMMLHFSASPLARGSRCWQASNLHLWADPIARPDWERFTTIVDSAVDEINDLAAATTHAARLTFLFNYEKQADVSTDLRREYFAPLFRQFEGELKFVDPASYRLPIEINEWNVHPTGMPLAWEGEYVFAARTPIAEIDDAVHELFGCSLRQGWPTLLPIRELEGVPCRFTLMPRYF